MHYRISFIFVTFISLFCFALPGVAQDANTDESNPVIMYSGTPKKYEIADIKVEGVKNYEDYVLISSSAVYPEYAPAPFTEEIQLAENVHWGAYGTNKIAAEAALMQRNPKAYILRPPYLYGPMNNVYREAFVFDCALENRKFYLPQEGGMKLQFFHVEDLCRFIDILVEKQPEQHIFNIRAMDPALTVQPEVAYMQLVNVEC